MKTREFPPNKVMQTAVVGSGGSLSYRLNLDGFPANARAYAYLAEIEDLGINETRKFKMEQPHVPGGYNNVVVNIAENANGSYTLYEPSYMNISLDFVLSFSFVKTQDSTRGPLLNAIEICKYVQIIPKTDNKDGKSNRIFLVMFCRSMNFSWLLHMLMFELFLGLKLLYWMPLETYPKEVTGLMQKVILVSQLTGNGLLAVRAHHQGSQKCKSCLFLIIVVVFGIAVM